MKTFQTMLKHLYIVVFFIAFVCAAWLVALQRQEILQASVPIENRTVILENSSDKSETPSPSTMQQRAAITPLPGELFLKTIDINLDDDEDFEQIIVSKKGPSSTSLEIVVADFLSTLGIYSRYFDGAVAATKLDSIIVQTMDMTTDGLPDLIVQGLDEFNNQTLTVFQRSQNRGYASIFSGTGTDITIQEQDNSDNIAPATITVQSPSESAGMVIQTTYKWNERLSSFEKASETLLRDDDRPSLGLAEADTQTFLLWLNRLWTRNTDTSDLRSLFVDVQSNTLILGAPQLQQRWIIQSAVHNGNRLYLTCSISESGGLSRLVVIDAKTQDEISVGIVDQQVSRFRRDEGWSGIYHLASSTNQSRSLQTEQPDIDLFWGRYLGSDHSVLVLTPSKSIIVLEKKYREGIAKFYNYAEYRVLDFLQIEPNGLAAARLIFVVEVDLSDDGAIRQLHLVPAHIGPTGVQFDYRPPYVFTKTS
jgi:hypothetical protein